eukprot:gene9426-11176_t
MPRQPDSTDVDAMVLNPAFGAGHGGNTPEEVGILRCANCNAKLQFCTCNVRRSTMDMATAGGRKKSNAASVAISGNEGGRPKKSTPHKATDPAKSGASTGHSGTNDTIIDIDTDIGHSATNRPGGGHNQLNLMGNFSSDCFNSLIDEATGLLTMFTVYRTFSPKKLFLVAGAVYGFNVFIRFCIGMYSLISPPKGSHLARDKNSERIFCTTWLRVVAGIILIMLEPVSGIWLLNSAFKPKPPLTKQEEKDLADSEQKATDVANNAKALIEVAQKKIYDLSRLNNKERAAETTERAKQDLAVVELEVTHLKLLAAFTPAQSKARMISAAVEVRKRKFELARARMKGTETVEVQMALFEDVPEIGVAVAFVVMGGLANATQSDVSLFITSIVVSLFHALKCFWSFWKLRKTIQAAKLADTDTLETYESSSAKI